MDQQTVLYAYNGRLPSTQKVTTTEIPNITDESQKIMHKETLHKRAQVDPVLLHLSILCRADTAFVFCKLKVCGKTSSSKSLGAIFLRGSDDG